jgi:hypothetical protein
VHPDPLMSQSALGFRGSCREEGARCARQVVICIWRMCHPLQRSQVVTPVRPMNCLRMLGLVILSLMRLATLMHQLQIHEVPRLPCIDASGIQYTISCAQLLYATKKTEIAKFMRE